MPEPKCLGLLLCFRDGFGNDFTANIFVTENMFKIIRSNFVLEWASLVAQLVKNVCLQCGRPGFDPWVGKISWRREMLPTPVFWPGELATFTSLHALKYFLIFSLSFHFLKWWSTLRILPLSDFPVLFFMFYLSKPQDHKHIKLLFSTLVIELTLKLICDGGSIY